MRLITAVLAIGLLAPAAYAGEGAITSNYDVTVKGVTVMKLRYSAKLDGGSYVSSLVAKTTGMTKWFSDYKIEYASEGGIAKGRFLPVNFSRERKKNGKKSGTGVQWQGGVPQFDLDDVKGPERVLNVVSKGATDPLAFLLTLGMTESGQPCKGKHRVFDGRDVMDAALTASAAEDGTIKCKITSRTIAGRSYEGADDKDGLVDIYNVTFKPMAAPFLGRNIYMPVMISGTASGQEFVAEADDINISGGTTN